MATSPVTPATPSVPLTSYLGPIVGADWTGRWLSYHQGYFRVTRLFLLAYFAACIVGAVLNVIAPDSLRHLNWIAAMAFLVAAAVCILTPLNLLGPAGAAFIAAQPGGEEGLSLQDGTNAGEKWINALGRFAAAIALYGSLPFFVLALWPIGSNPLGAIAILACAVFLTIWSMYTNRDGKFVLGLAATIMTVLIVWTLASWTPIVREYQQDLVAWTQHKLGLKSADNRSTDAKRAAEQARAELQAACFDGLKNKATKNPPVIPTAAEFEDCANKGVPMTTTVDYRNEAEKARAEAMALIRNARIAEAAQCFKALSAEATIADRDRCEALRQAIEPTTVSEPLTPVRVPANQSTDSVDTVVSCNTAWKEFDYEPSKTLGPMSLGKLPPGVYDIEMTGKIWQTFYNPPHQVEQVCEMDAAGRFTTCAYPETAGRMPRDMRGQPFIAKPTVETEVSPLLVPGEEYGKVVIHGWGKPLPSVNGRLRIQTGSELPIAVDVNNYQATESYVGHGILHGVIKQCQTT